MRVLLLIGLLVCTMTLSVLAQSARMKVVNGDGQPVPGAHLHLVAVHQYVITGEDGWATIEFGARDSLVIEVSYIGYIKTTRTLFPGQEITLTLEEDQVTLNAMVVTGQYSANNPEKAVQKVTIVSEEKIKKMAAVNLRDALTNEMNVRLTRDNVLGTGVSIQGMSGENVKVLIDGVPVVGRLNGNIDLSQINMNDVERIEIVEGPMSVNYGTNALAGVINVITKKPGREQINFSANSYYESIGRYNVDAGLSLAHKKGALSFSGGRNYFDGWSEGDAHFTSPERIADSNRFQQWKPKEQYFLRAGYEHSYDAKSSLRYSLNYFDEKITNRGYPLPPYGETAFDDYYYTTRFDNSLNWDHYFGKNHRATTILAYNQFERISNTWFKDLTTLEETLTENPGDQDTANTDQWVLRTSFASLKDSVKVNYEVGTDFNVETGTGARIEGGTQQIGDYAGYGSLEYRPYRNTVIRPGLRYAYNTRYDAPATPSLNIRQKVGHYIVRASYARGFRAPSIKELYFDFVDINHNIVGNQDLKAEHSHHIGLSGNFTKLIDNYLLKVELSAFYNQMENMITLAQIDNVQYSYVNIGEYSTHGIQLNSNIAYNHLKFGIGASYIGRYNQLSDEHDIDPYSYTPEIQSQFNYDFPRPQMYVAFFYKYTGKLPGFGLTTDGDVIPTFIESYHTGDLSVGKYFWKKRFQLVVGSKNIFDVKNVASGTVGGAHSGAGGTSAVATGRLYFMKLTLNLQHERKKE